MMHPLYPSKYYFINTFDTNLISKQDKNTAIIYRNYTVHKNRLATILKIKKICKKKNIKFLLANDIKLSINLNLDGAYIPSFNKGFNHLNYNFKKKFFLMGSAHNLREIRIKEAQKVQAIFISSLFKKKNFLGIYKFKKLSKLTKKRVIALGGISKKNIKKLSLINSQMFAGISFFE